MLTRRHLSGVAEGLPRRGRPHGHPDGRLGLHHRVGAERAVGGMLAEHVQAAQLLLPHLRSHRDSGEELPRELPDRWGGSALSRQPSCPGFLLLIIFITFSGLFPTESRVFNFELSVWFTAVPPLCSSVFVAERHSPDQKGDAGPPSSSAKSSSRTSSRTRTRPTSSPAAAAAVW